MSGQAGNAGAMPTNTTNPNGTGMGIPFINSMPKNLIAPTFGEGVYNPQQGAQMGTNISPFYGPNNTLSGQFGKFLQPGFPDPTAPPPPMPPPGPRPANNVFEFPAGGRYLLPADDPNWQPAHLPNELQLYKVDEFGYLIPQTQYFGLPDVQQWNAETPPTYQWGEDVRLDESGLPRQRWLRRQIAGEPTYDDYGRSERRALASNLLGLYSGSLFQ